MADHPKSNAAEREEQILSFWNERDIFKKSLEKEAPNGEYVFYDGPPFANGLPHYGHIVASVIKDAVPRYWTMRGYRVPRRWGWDCHGLPVENEVEKELGFTSKKDIIEYGVGKFNQACRESVLKYTDEWKKLVPRIGRWADMKDSYTTMDKDFMESVWWVFKQLWDQGLVYEDYRSMHICPRCETTLSQQEVAEGYAEITDLSVTAKFELVDEPGTFLLAWTTTPWTLPGNVALAVGEDIEYVKVEYLFRGNEKEAGKKVTLNTTDEKRVIVAKERLEEVLENVDEYKIIQEIKGSELVGKAYKPLFDYYAKDSDLENHARGWKVYAADFVSTEEGTGIVHIAPAFGDEDMALGKREQLPFVQHVRSDGTFKEAVHDFAGMHVKPKEDVQATDVEIVKYLAHNNLLFAKKKITHTYSLCWRCDTPLLNYATNSWFVAVTKVKEGLLQNAEHINWSPNHVKAGRFGNWLEGARDWSISRQRFWASVIPLWRCDACDAVRVFGSISDLEAASGQQIADLHKDVVDEITFACECGSGIMRRVPDVLDTWFDSGSMPYAQAHYPFEHKEYFEKTFPANFIAEGIDQTRAWFYYLHVLGGALRQSHAFQNVIVNGIVQAEDGKKMSKKLKNYPDPAVVLDKYGADALRLYLLSSPIVRAENLDFAESGVDEVAKKTIGRLANVVSFYKLYEKDVPHGETPATHTLDRWMVARAHQLIQEVTEAMDRYALDRATRPIADFVDDLSTWYLRRSRERIKAGGDDAAAALGVLRGTLLEFAKVTAPFIPFTAEWLWQELGADEAESVHLAVWPSSAVVNEEVLAEMGTAREIVSLALEARANAGIKVRQPLAKLSIAKKLSPELLDIIADEVNVKTVHIDEKQEQVVVLDTKLTPALEEEGMARELIRMIQAARKENGFSVADRAQVVVRAPKEWEGVVERFRTDIQEATGADTLLFEESAEVAVGVAKA